MVLTLKMDSYNEWAVDTKEGWKLLMILTSLIISPLLITILLGVWNSCRANRRKSMWQRIKGMVVLYSLACASTSSNFSCIWCPTLLCFMAYSFALQLYGTLGHRDLLWLSSLSTIAAASIRPSPASNVSVTASVFSFHLIANAFSLLLRRAFYPLVHSLSTRAFPLC